jgi:anti-anti-sigma factor
MTDVLEHDATDCTPVEFCSTASLSVLTITGELNRTSIAALEMQIDQIGCSECDDVVLDVAGLRRLDPIGTSVLIGMGHYVRALGGRLTVTGASGQVGETLATARLALGQAPDFTRDKPTAVHTPVLPALASSALPVRQDPLATKRGQSS